MKQRNYIFDCGSQYGSGLQTLLERYRADSLWQVFSFEPDANCLDIARKRDYNLGGINFTQAAAWVEDGEAGIPQTARSENSRAVSACKTIDLSLVLKDLVVEKSFVVLALNLDGSEFEVLRKLAKDKTLSLVDELLVNFHANSMATENARSLQDLKEILTVCNPRMKLQAYPL